MTRISEPVPGIRLITLPLPFELEHVHAGLVRLSGSGYLLIDAGLDGQLSFEALSLSLRQLGIGWSEISAVLATHIHPDHMGGIPAVLSASGAQFWMHHAEFKYLNGIVEGVTPWLETGLRQGGVPRDQWDVIRSSLSGLRSSLSLIHPHRFVQDGELIATALGPAMVVSTPGHSAGHVCLYWPEHQVLYSGDHLIEKITPNIGWMPGRDMLGEYLDSLQAIERLDVRLVIASHGKPFTNCREWIAATRRHHEDRCNAILRAIGVRPRTACELIPSLWDREFSSFQMYFALFEILAHLEHMRRAGRCGSEFSETGSLRWVGRAHDVQPSALPNSATAEAGSSL